MCLKDPSNFNSVRTLKPLNSEHLKLEDPQRQAFSISNLSSNRPPHSNLADMLIVDEETPDKAKQVLKSSPAKGLKKSNDRGGSSDLSKFVN